MDNNLNIIVKEGAVYVLRVLLRKILLQTKIQKHIKLNMPYNFPFFYENSFPLHLKKPTFKNLTNYVFMRREQEGQNRSTPYHVKLHSPLMHMYCTTKLDMTENFRYGLSHFMLIMSIATAKDSQNRAHMEITG